MVALVPSTGQVGRDPGGDGSVVGVAQAGKQDAVEAGLTCGAGGPDRFDGFAQGVCGLAGPHLGRRVEGVHVVQVARQVSDTLLDAGQVGVVAEVAAVVITNQDPAEAVKDPEADDRGLRAVAWRPRLDAWSLGALTVRVDHGRAAARLALLEQFGPRHLLPGTPGGVPRH